MRMGRSYSLLWYVPPVILAIAGGITDPANMGMRTGDPSYWPFYIGSQWLFLIAIAYIPVFLFTRLLLRMVRLLSRLRKERSGRGGISH
jgi:hypothetical protein